MNLLLTNATLYTPERCLARGSVWVRAGRIAAVQAGMPASLPTDALVLDLSGCILTPGFVDLQINGGFGHDFTAEPASIWQVARQLPRSGVTAFLPTILSAPTEARRAAQAVLAAGAPDGFRGARPLGLHFEGPFLNPAKTGAHNPAHLRTPDLEAVQAWSPETHVRLTTLAPELPGALEMIELLSARGVLVSAGHSTADFTQAMAGFEAGVRYGTHLFNAMSSLLHRDPGLPGALLTDERVTVGLIADGIHTHPAAVKLAWQVLGPQRLNLVTDAMAALGMPPGTHWLGDYPVIVDGHSCRLADGTLAGSILPLDQALRNLILFSGCSVADALATVTVTPARLLGLEQDLGRLAPGLRADLVVLSPDLRVLMTVIGGEVVYSAGANE